VSKFKGLNDKVRLIWSAADLLRSDYRADEYGQVILPLTVLRRLDCMLEPPKGSVLATANGLADNSDNIDPTRLRAGAAVLRRQPPEPHPTAGRRPEHRREPAHVYRWLQHRRRRGARQVRLRQPDHALG
jgi:hypothetical protein